MPPRISRRVFTAAAAIAAATVCSPAVRAQGSRVEKTRVAIAVPNRAAFSVLPLTIACQLGFFRAEGVGVELVDGMDSSQMLQDGVAGPVDIISGSFDNALALQARGQLVQSVVLQTRAPQVAVGVSLRALPAYRGVADLRGRRMGIAPMGTSSGMVARLVLSRGGLGAADVRLLTLDSAHGAIDALRSGRIAAMSYIDPLMTMLEQRGELRIIGDTRTLKGSNDVFGGPMPASCLYAPLDFVQKNPATCQAVANGVVHALKWLQTAGPSDIIKTVPEPYLLGDRALYLSAFSKLREAMSPDGMVEDDAARTAQRIVASFNPQFKPASLDVGRVFTNHFARKAKEKFRA